MGENATEIFERLSRIEQGVARIDERTERKSFIDRLKKEDE